MSQGSWSAVLPWPVIGIHAVLLPNGNVFTFGTDQAGNQGTAKVYDVWDPLTGMHTTTRDSIVTDEFCSGVILDSVTGNVIITGGDGRPQGNINHGVTDVNTYDYRTNTNAASATGHLNLPRWYGDAISLGNGSILALGGENATGVSDNAIALGNTLGPGQGTPEIYTPGAGWHELTGAADPTFSALWYYPRAWLSSNGNVEGFAAGGAGNVFALYAMGNGSIAEYGSLPFQTQSWSPAVEFAQDKILTLDQNGNSWIVDISAQAPTFAISGRIGANRTWSDLTDLADGTVLLTSGSVNPIDPATTTNYAQIYHPDTGQWSTETSVAAIDRFYHSTSLLLTDGTVLSSGGGAPGPFTNLNSEIYTPGYLLNPNGSLRTDRPVITSAPTSLEQGQTFILTLDNADVIQKLQLIKFGASTHSLDAEQRATSLQFTHIDSKTLQVTIPPNANFITDGYWMLFADNANGTPSVAATIKIGGSMIDVYSPELGTSLTTGGTLQHLNASSVYTLTQDLQGQNGSLMSDRRVDFSQTFDIQFGVTFGAKANPADGLAFVLHNDPNGANATGQAGAGLGAGGLQNGIALQFDLWQNIDKGDMAGPHTGIITTDPQAAAYRLTQQTALANLTDGNYHNVQVAWDPTTHILTYSYDGVQIGQLAGDLVNSYFGGSRYVYFGFTGSTGGASDVGRVSLHSLNATFETAANVPVMHTNDGSIFDPNSFGQHVVLNGAASFDATHNTVTLTPNVTNTIGSAFFDHKVDLTHNFDFNFSLNFGPNHPADGATFLLTNDPAGANALGKAGGYLGAIGLQNGLAAEFDTYQNTTLGFNDPAYNHTGFVNTAAGAGGYVSASYGVGNIADGGWHQVGLSWDAQAHVLSYWVDGNYGGKLNADIAATYLAGQTSAYVGFTAGTGGSSDTQQVRIAAVDATFIGTPAYSDQQDPVAVASAARINGAAIYDATSHTFTLTPAAAGQAGSAFLGQRIDLAYNFQVAFDLNFGNNAHGADGISFILQNDARGAGAIGAGGGNLGAIGIKNGIAIAFDTFQNADIGETTFDHGAFLNTSATFAHSRISDQTMIGNGNVKDGTNHHVVVSYSATDHTLTYYFDGQKGQTLTEDLAAKYLGGSHLAYLGFGAGTGGLSNDQQVHLDNLTAYFEGQTHPTTANLVSLGLVHA